VTTEKKTPATGHPLGSGPLLEPSTDDSRAMIKAAVESGAAVHPPEDGKLPPGATHVIVGKTEAGEPILQRARFSLVPPRPGK
jgi:hypothetical protein